jgi:hypothetical protein
MTDVVGDDLEKLEVTIRHNFQLIKAYMHTYLDRYVMAFSAVDIPLLIPSSQES